MKAKQVLCAESPNSLVLFLDLIGAVHLLLLSDASCKHSARGHALYVGAGADMQWCTQDGTKGLLELAWEEGHLHTLPLLVSMGVGWRGRSGGITQRRFYDLLRTQSAVVRLARRRMMCNLPSRHVSHVPIVVSALRAWHISSDNVQQAVSFAKGLP
jgi:hypothetical protein